MYNALGHIIKDIIKLLSIKYCESYISTAENSGEKDQPRKEKEREVNLRSYDFVKNDDHTLMFDEKMRINERKNLSSKVSTKK